MTREQWLLRMIERLRSIFNEAAYPLPLHIRVSCGWPTQRALSASGKNRSIGQCFSTACSADGAHEVFVSPALDDKQRVAEVLVHELCHAVDNCTARDTKGTTPAVSFPWNLFFPESGMHPSAPRRLPLT